MDGTVTNLTKKVEIHLHQYFELFQNFREKQMFVVIKLKIKKLKNEEQSVLHQYSHT